MTILILLILGLCLGSFVNALVWRLHAQAVSRTHNPKLSILKGRSMCVHCSHKLVAADLIPFFSWLFLRGKCRYCGQKIDDMPIVELLLPILFIISYVTWPYDIVGAEWLSFVVWVVLLTGCLALVVYDFRWMELPNRIVYPLLGLVLMHSVALSLLHNPYYLQQSAVGAVSLGGLFLLLFLLSKGAWIGGGDVKLGFVLGTWIGGFFNSVFLLFLASLSGTIFVLALWIMRREIKKRRIAFGPFLILGLLVLQFGAARVLESYVNSALLP